jgi:GNAT superfamily N-acetyltransferase
VTVAPLDPDSAADADVAAMHAAHIAAMTVDSPDDPQPPLADFALRLHDQRDDQRRHWFVARSGDDVIGYAKLWLPLLHNLHAGEAEVVVRPESRRQGTGTALLREAVAALSSEHRRLLVTSTRGDAGDGFCRTLGLQLVQTARISLLRLADVDWADVRAAAAAEHPGYRIRAYTGVCPDDLIEPGRRGAHHRQLGDQRADAADQRPARLPAVVRGARLGVRGRRAGQPAGVSLRAPASASRAASTPDPTATPNAARPLAASTT